MLNQTMFDLGMSDEKVSVLTSNWTCNNGICGFCAKSILSVKQMEEATYAAMLQEYDVLRRDFGSSKADRSLARLSRHPFEQMWFDLMRSYGQVGKFLSVFSLIGIILYFVTSSDSGSLVIDCLSANGKAFIEYSLTYLN